jgi:hypothetical protein
MKKLFIISSERLGVVFGEWNASSALEAYQEMMVAAGYSDQKSAESAGFEFDEIPSDIQVSELTPLEPFEG